MARVKLDKLPDGPWLRVWVLACLGNLIALGGLEMFWRSRGHEPGVSAAASLWCYHRERVENADNKTIVLVGASRLQTGFATEVFLEDHPGYEVVQLAVPGRGGFATLRDLAATETFRGIVIWGDDARALQPSQLEEQQDLVDHYRKKWGPGERIDILLSTMLQENLVFMQPTLSGVQLVAKLVHGKTPDVNYMKTLFSRRWVADYGRVNVDGLVKARAEYFEDRLRLFPPAPLGEWRAVVREMAGFAKKIESRGGRVVFVSFPVRGRIKELNDENYPRDTYWAMLVNEIGIEVIDHEAMPGVEQLDCPDGSHLDSDSANAFTRWLGQELKARGCIE